MKHTTHTDYELTPSRTTVVDGVTVTDYELTPAAKQALTVNATLPAAEPVRETFDPGAVRALVAAVRTRLSHGVNTALRTLVKAVEESERKP